MILDTEDINKSTRESDMLNKTTIALIAAFTIGALTVEIRNLRGQLDHSKNMEKEFWEGYEAGRKDNEPLDSFVHIEEDDPRWDCNTMGNRICGERY